MTRTLALILTTATACGALPHMAHASCGGSACHSFSYASNKFTNNDKDLKIRLTGCFLQANGTCAPSANFDITIDPNSSKSVTPPAAVGLNAKVDVKTAAFLGALTHPHVQTLPNGNTALIEIAAVAVKNDGKLPVKVVILDGDFKELGRTSDYKAGSFLVDLKTHVSKYHWEVFAPGDVEPCEKQRDETKSSITVHCQHSKAEEKTSPPSPADLLNQALKNAPIVEERDNAVRMLQIYKKELDTLQKDLKDLEQKQQLSEEERGRKSRIENQIKEIKDKMKTAEDIVKRDNATLYPRGVPLTPSTVGPKI